MKRNILSIIVIALCAMNLIMSVVLVFAVVPASSKTNKLIGQVASVLNLELESRKEKEKEKEIALKDKETVPFEGDYTINLKKTPGDDKDHYAITKQLSITLNKKGKGYKDVSPRLETDQSVIIGIFTDAFADYSKEDMALEEKKDEVKQKVIKKLQEYYNSECIIDVSFGNLMFS